MWSCGERGWASNSTVRLWEPVSRGPIPILSCDPTWKTSRTLTRVTFPSLGSTDHHLHVVDTEIHTNTYSGAKKYLVRHQLCKFSHLKRWERPVIFIIIIFNYDGPNEKNKSRKSHCRIFNEFFCKLWWKIIIGSITKYFVIAHKGYITEVNRFL